MNLATANPKLAVPPLPVTSLSAAMEDFTLPSVAQVTHDPAIVRRWGSGDLWHGIPEEFHGATLSDELRQLLNARPPSFALVGPPGTGKTRTLWAMVHAMRVAKTRDLMGQPIERPRVTDGQYTTRQLTYTEAIDLQLRRSEGMAIITESGDIRGGRYNREALTSWATCRRWLAVDDVGFIEPSEWVREALYHLANERRSAGLHTVWTSNLSVAEIRATFGAAIASRILGGEVVEVGGNDRRLQP